jgi:hypothetical protein
MWAAPRNYLVVSLLVSLLGAAACVPVPSPFSGPGVAAQTGLFTSVDEARVAVTTATRVDLASVDGTATLDAHLHAMELAFAEEPEAFVGASVRRVLFGVDGWTLSVWSDQAAADAFLDDSWRADVPQGATLRSVMWELPAHTPSPPTWGEALLELKLHGEDER